MTKLSFDAWKVAVVGTLLSVAVGSAWAGLKSSVSVNASTTFKSGYGSIGNARNSTDSVQYIGCTVVWNASEQAASCYAKSASGVVYSCYVLNTSPLYNLIQSINSDDYISFAGNAEGICDSLVIMKGSKWAPKNL